MEIKKFDCTYKAEHFNESYTFQVIPDKMKPVPETLFKLFTLSDNSLNALLNGYIYATHPDQFNDVFDCHAQLIDFDVPEVIREFLKYGFSEEEINDWIVNSPRIANQHAQVNFKAIIYRKWGVYSMTDNPYNMLLWSYYSNHQGFQIEFDYSKFPFKCHGPFPINYCKNLESVKFSEMERELAVLIQSNVKRKEFEIEKEWRILVEPDEDMVSPCNKELEQLGGRSRCFNYPLSAIKSITLGARFFEPEERKLKEDKLEWNILKENLMKRKFIEFLYENEINVGVAPPNPLNQIGFKFGRVNKLNDNVFELNFFDPEKVLPLTLSDAMAKLLQFEERFMTSQEIADMLNRNCWYKKQDGSLIESNQIHARKNKYPDVFRVDNTVTPQLIGLV